MIKKRFKIQYTGCDKVAEKIVKKCFDSQRVPISFQSWLSDKLKARYDGMEELGYFTVSATPLQLIADYCNNVLKFDHN